MRTQRKLALLALITALTACEYEGGEGGSYGGGGESEGGSYGGGGGGEGDEGDGGGNGGTGGGSSGSCNDANESCGPNSCGGEGGTMLPGANCLACHTSGGGEAPKFTAAGTVFTDIDGSGKSSNATVYLTDANGQSVTLSTNSAGNFYTTKSLTFPLTAEVDKGGFTMAMGSEISTGACNSCHQCGGQAGGKLYTD